MAEVRNHFGSAAGKQRFEVGRVIPADHHSLPGHFPGRPIVPGVVILDEVAAAVTEWREGYQIAAMPFIKFLVPLEPNQPFTIALAGPANELDFCCRAEGRVIVEGRVEITRSEP